MKSSRRVVVVLGEGGATGLFVGGVLGAWEIGLNEDLAHRMFWLATARLVGPMAQAAAWGALASAALALVLAALARRWPRSLKVGIVCLGLLWLAGLAAIASPLRDTVLILHRFSSHAQTGTVFGLCAAASLLLLVRRCRDVMTPSRDMNETIGRLRFVTSVLAAGAAAATLLFSALLPRLSSARAAGRPSIILVSLDTLRADRLGVLGAARPRTPLLDRLAGEGMVFEQATSAAPWTLPSHASLFASRLPFDQRRKWDYNREVPLHQTLLAEWLRQAGYRTAAFTGGGYVSSLCGFGQGFEIYEDHDEEKEGGPDGIAAAALAWARSVRNVPFFLFVHTYEPHFPYRHADFANPSDAGRLPQVVSYKEVDAIHRGDLVLSEAERRYVTDLYDGDVAHADRVFGSLLQTLRADGILDHALVIVLSDHGEELWDREPDYSPDHGHSLHQELVHVPLVLRWPGRIPAGSRIRTPVSLVDVTPTVLDLTGLASDPAYEGRSLAVTTRTGEEPQARPLLAEATEYGPDRFMIREGDLKVILTPYPQRFNIVSIPARPLEVFDLAADPQERHDLSAHITRPGAQMVDVLWQRARSVLRDSKREDDEAPPLPEELLQQLRSLGYLR